ncbi:hypothetical protein [Niabella soli]|uniref:Uncharacterized protein n=1 Tax=Niabella soli DSM 19437 TaxID=929713 RepID=W0F2B0_9BACT|nr:hypothetical protein [Niabella soli]AHF17142.1 hypothetical protein NIASO_02410 [Niabella soli DSM 19437]
MKKFLAALCFGCLFFAVRADVYSNNPALYRKLVLENIQLKIAMKKVFRQFNRLTDHAFGKLLAQAGGNYYYKTQQSVV